MSGQPAECWEDIGEDDELRLQAADARREEVDVEDADTISASDVGDYTLPMETDMRAALLVAIDGREVSTAPLESGAAIEALIEEREARHALVKDDEQRRTVDGVEYAIVHFADEIDGTSSLSLWQTALSSSRFAVVRELKRLSSEAARSPTWKAHMATELDRLAAGCAKRKLKLDGLRRVKRAFEARSRLAEAAVHAETEHESLYARAQTALLTQVAKRVRQIDSLIRELDDVPPEETPRSLLDAILAMILLRHPRPNSASIEEHCTRLQHIHDSIVQAWLDELGLLPRRDDAITGVGESSRCEVPEVQVQLH